MGKLKNKPTQCQRIVEYISKHGGITSRDAYIDLGITQLGARIFELKEKGVIFDFKWIEVANRFGEKCRVKEYFIVESEV